MTNERGGLKLVGESIDAAAAAPKVAPPEKGKGKRSAGAWVSEEPELPFLPAGCPVKPLGHNGLLCYFLDEAGQLIAIDPQKLGQATIKKLFGRKSELCDEYWPRVGQGGLVTGWRSELGRDILQRACAFAGIFDPQGKVLGRGAHRGKKGELILHCGDTVYVGGPDGGYMEPGLIEGLVYPTAPGIPRPDPEEVGTGTAEQLLALFRTWNWERPLLDPMLLLGWVAAAIVGGALRWRPHAWVTGSSATGKSTLQQALELLFDGAALHTHDATEAALRQTIKQQTLPVFFDELEAEEDNRRNKQVINLARLASSGGKIFRGGQDHQSHEFRAQNCFLFSSILLPPMLAQDRNRLAILELQRFPQGAVAPVLDDAWMVRAGRELRRRLVDQWPRLEATLHAYREALARNGHGGRSQDQFGTLLACADLLLNDYEPEVEALEDWGRMLKADTLAEKAGDVSDEDEAVQFLATTPLPGRGGDEPEPVSRHIERGLIEDGGEKARDRLENFGLKLVNITVTVDPAGGAERVGATGRLKKGEPVFLAIANNHEALARIFKDKRWSEGVWVQAFGRVEGARKRVRIRYAGSSPIWSTVIPIAAIVAPMTAADPA